VPSGSSDSYEVVLDVHCVHAFRQVDDSRRVRAPSVKEAELAVPTSGDDQVTGTKEPDGLDRGIVTANLLRHWRTVVVARWNCLSEIPHANCIVGPTREDRGTIR